MKRSRFQLILLAALACGGTLATAAPDDGAAAFERALELLARDESKGALIELKNAVQAAPNYLPAWLKLGEVYLDSGYGALAEGAFERASKLGADPSLTVLPRARSYLLQGKLDELLALDAAGKLAAADEATLLVLQGNAQLEAGLPVEAMALFDRAQAINAISPAPLWGRALAKLRQGDQGGALYEADRAKALAPELAETWFVRADIERQIGQREDALRDFSRALEIEPSHTPARLGRAALQMDAGRLDEAAADLSLVRAAQPDDLQGMHLQALLLAQQGKTGESEAVLAEARARLKELPEHVMAGHLPSLMLNAVIALKDGQPQAAAEHLRRYLARAKDHLGATKLLAAALIQAGEYNDARALLEPLVMRHKEDAALLSLLGTTYARLGDNTLAEAMLERAIELGADTATLRQQLGLVQLAAGDHGAALASFGKAAAANPAGEAPFMQALTALRDGSLEQAQTLVDKLLAAHPREPAYHNFNGSLALMRNDPAAARTAWQHALDVEPDYLPAQLNLAGLARTERDWAGAKQLYRQLLARHPDNADVLRGLADLAVAQGHPKEAQRRLKALRQQHPADLEAGLALVASLFETRDFDSARSELQTLARQHADDVRPLLQTVDLDTLTGGEAGLAPALAAARQVAAQNVDALRLVLQRQVQYGLLDNALDTAQQVLQLRPADLRAHQEVGEIEIQLRRFEEASARARALETKFVESPVGPGLRAKIALARQDPAAAVEALSLALARAPDALPLAVARAQARLQAGDTATAVSELQALAARAPAALPPLGDALLATGRWAEAAVVLEKILGVDARNVGALNNLAWAYQQAGDQRAVATAERLLALAPDDAASLDTAGWVFIEAGKARDGVRVLRNALAREPKVPAIRYHLAVGLSRLGEKAEAAALLDQVTAAPAFQEQAAATELLRQLQGEL